MCCPRYHRGPTETQDGHPKHDKSLKFIGNNSSIQNVDIHISPRCPLVRQIERKTASIFFHHLCEDNFWWSLMCGQNSSYSKWHLGPRNPPPHTHTHSAKAGKRLKDKEWDPAGMLRTASCLLWSWLHSGTKSLYCWQLLPLVDPGQVSPSTGQK